MYNRKPQFQEKSWWDKVPESISCISNLAAPVSLTTCMENPSRCLGLHMICPNLNHHPPPAPFWDLHYNDMVS